MLEHYVGENVFHRGHPCRVTAVWYDPDSDKTGVTIEPTGGYGFPIDLYDDQLKATKYAPHAE